ncbi:hypothetical protein QBC35DRAFT_67156 [Podospora australis]|uniref:Uncharacterized protein n=1 Tax=Podospora australis TaxID=1536484 RepID=A0AAN7AEE4_9PEZI|nr:hypothetical protein QBC35DRAFT_67156 [Podospora australis]
MAPWFPIGKDESDGWRLDIVALLAVTGESFIGEHALALTSSKLCLLPRLMPAPHCLLQPRRPASLPSEDARVVGVYGGTVAESVGFFANIIHPLDQLRPFEFKILEIRHRDLELGDGHRTRHQRATASGVPFNSDLETASAEATGQTSRGPGAGGLSRRVTLSERAARFASNAPAVQDNTQTTIRFSDHEKEPDWKKSGSRGFSFPFSVLHSLSVVSFFLTLGTIVAAVSLGDGTALVAVCLLSFATSIIGWAAWWKPSILSSARRRTQSHVPPGDLVIRTREGAFVVVRCTEDIARELYWGGDRCEYVVTGIRYRVLMTLGAVLMMPSVILMGNCTFEMQLILGSAYLALNIAYWLVGLLPLSSSWDLSRYQVSDVTPEDSRDNWERLQTYTECLWFAIRETKHSSWVERSGSAPSTEAWKTWVREAAEQAVMGNRDWNAQSRLNELVQMDHISEGSGVDALG